MSEYNVAALYEGQDEGGDSSGYARARKIIYVEKSRDIPYITLEGSPDVNIEIPKDSSLAFLKTYNPEVGDYYLFSSSYKTTPVKVENGWVVKADIFEQRYKLIADGSGHKVKEVSGGYKRAKPLQGDIELVTKIGRLFKAGMLEEAAQVAMTSRLMAVRNGRDRALNKVQAWDKDVDGKIFEEGLSEMIEIWRKE